MHGHRGNDGELAATGLWGVYDRGVDSPPDDARNLRPSQYFHGYYHGSLCRLRHAAGGCSSAGGGTQTASSIRTTKSKSSISGIIFASPDVVDDACNYRGRRLRLQALIVNFNAQLTKRLKSYNLFITTKNSTVFMQS